LELPGKTRNDLATPGQGGNARSGSSLCVDRRFRRFGSRRRIRGGIGIKLPPPGTVINATNASTYAQFLPPAAEVGIDHGMTLRVVQSKRLDWSGGFTSETEKYSGQVGLDKDDYITNYVGGMPFPIVSTIDPKAEVGAGTRELFSKD
jgi:hypothetical protein